MHFQLNARNYRAKAQSAEMQNTIQIALLHFANNMLQLETYKGTKSRHICPSCGRRGSFVRYVGDDGNYIDETVGKCNRDSKCSYHRKPREFFADNPHLSKSADFKPKARARSNYGFAVSNSPQPPIEAKAALVKPDHIAADILLRTLGNYENNSFVSFLFNLFSEDTEAVEKAVKDYLIGTTRDGATIFWQIDRRRNVRTGKIIAYDAGSGKRRKDITPNWIHAKLKKSGHLTADFNLQQCFFGEHLLPMEKDKPLAIVEAEKTAVIASICFPEFLWLACGGKQNVKVENLQRLAGRQVILYPDSDGFNLWAEKAREARANGLTVKVSSLIENYGTDAQKADGYDLADYLIERANRINQLNENYDDYNTKLQKVLNDEILFQEFDSMLDEQKAVMIIDGGLSEIEAEKIVCNMPNFRRIVSIL